MSPAAVDILARDAGLAIAPSEYEHGATGVDLDNFMLDAVNELKLDIDIAGSIVDGTIERTMDGASTLDVTVHDPRRVLLPSSIWDYTLEVELDGNWFRQTQCSKSGDDLDLKWEDRIVAWMRSHNSPLKVSRSKMTRAEFIKHMVDEIRADNELGIPINFYCPELHKRQPIDRPKKDHERRSTRDGGLNTAVDLKVKGHAASGEQIRNAELILDAGVHKGANQKCLVAGIMTPIQESDLINLTGGDGDSVGLFQQRASWGSFDVRHNPTKSANLFFDACIKADADNPSLTLGELCQKVQVSAFPDAYSKWEKEAKQIVNEYGAGTGGSVSREFYKQYQFTRGQPGGPKGENTWQAGQRLAQEVNWRFFVVGNTVFLVNDDDLLKSKPIMVIDEDTDGIESIDGDLTDVNKPNNELTVECRAERWFANPGEVVTLKSTMGPAKGRWLVSRITRPLFNNKTEIALRRPVKPLPEPAPTLVTSQSTLGGIAVGGKVSGKSFRDRIVKAAQTALAERSKYVYSHQRPMPSSLFGKAPRNFDCSSFVIACYKAAGADDPSGNSYNGMGYTGDLQAHGRRTGTPKPGDLAFYGAGQGPNGAARHVAVYIGDGEVISHGHPGTPNQYAVNQPDFMYYMTYFLDPTVYRGTPPHQRHGGAATP